MPVLRQSLVRFCFLHTTRLLRTSSTPWARGFRPRNAESDGKELPQSFAEPLRDGFAERRQPKTFDMGKYTDAVRGDLDSKDERKHFIKQKPVWLKNQRPTGQDAMNEGSQIRWPRDPRDSVDSENAPKPFKKFHKKIYRPRTDEEDEEDEQSLEADNGLLNRFGKPVTKQARYEEEDGEDLRTKPRFSNAKTMELPKDSRRYGALEDRDSFNERDEADDEDPFAAQRAKKEIADRKKARIRNVRDESRQNSEREFSPKKRRDAFINDVRNPRYVDVNDNNDDDRTPVGGETQKRFERGTEVADRFSQDQRKTYSTTPSFPGLKVLKADDRMFKSTILTIKNRKERMHNRKILLEGVRLINDALESGIQLQQVFTCGPELLHKLHKETLKLSDPELLQVTQKQMTLWSDMTTPPGIIAIANMPDGSNFNGLTAMPLTVVLDNIRDPGNMGAIVRVLAGAGCAQIIATKNCTDPWDSKVLRAGSGGHFHIPIHYNVAWDMVPNYLEDSDMVLLAENVENSPVDPVDSGSRSDSDRKARYAQDLASELYHQVEMSDGSVVLVIGGETHGISSNAYAMASERKGIRLVIPMGNNMESLNAASAVAVIAFEMKRQRLANAHPNAKVAENE